MALYKTLKSGKRKLVHKTEPATVNPEPSVEDLPGDDTDETNESDNSKDSSTEGKQ